MGRLPSSQSHSGSETWRQSRLTTDIATQPDTGWHRTHLRMGPVMCVQCGAWLTWRHAPGENIHSQNKATREQNQQKQAFDIPVKQIRSSKSSSKQSKFLTCRQLSEGWSDALLLLLCLDWLSCWSKSISFRKCCIKAGKERKTELFPFGFLFHLLQQHLVDIVVLRYEEWMSDTDFRWLFLAKI